MANIGVISKDVITKTRLLDELEAAGHEVTFITSPIFDATGFDIIMVDLNAPSSLLVLKNYGHKCLAFAGANEENKIKAAKEAGCERVYAHGKFYKKILPNFKFP